MLCEYVHQCAFHFKLQFFFLQVIPVDSRGEALLAALRNPTNTSWYQERGSQVSLVDDDDLVCLHSSTEDLGKRVQTT